MRTLMLLLFLLLLLLGAFTHVSKLFQLSKKEREMGRLKKKEKKKKKKKYCSLARARVFYRARGRAPRVVGESCKRIMFLGNHFDFV